ncbi:c2H2-type domain-containing protein [Trichonephila clavipes]|nr:c2H2-type domain-containing protein [Trichonephila clavipes]
MPNSRVSSYLLQELDDHEGLSGEALELPPKAVGPENSTVVCPVQPASKREAHSASLPLSEVNVGFSGARANFGQAAPNTCKKNPCLSGQVVSLNGPGKGSWPCPSFDTVFTTKLGFLNHEISHKRQEIRKKMPALTIPVGPARRKAQRRKNIAAISTGDPGDMPLAQPPQSSSEQAPPNGCGIHYKRRPFTERERERQNRSKDAMHFGLVHRASQRCTGGG